MMLELIGYLGLLLVAICWLPQTLETLREGRCGANTLFLFLSALGSVCLTIYAVSRSDVVFSILNTLTGLGAFINLYYKFFPRAAA
jgi:lipid-A-disaccharide synthase-like uncharacterized protein